MKSKINLRNMIKRVSGSIGRKDQPCDLEVSNPPDVYNSDHESMMWIYLQDKSCMHIPHGFSPAGSSKYIIWDRYDYLLPYHMYTYEEVYHVRGKPKKKFAMFLEGKEIIPGFYEDLMKHRSMLKDFDGVFTNQDFLLNTLENAYFVPSSAPWYGSEFGGGTICEDNYKKKNKSISIISSDKEMCDLHRFRKRLALGYEKSKKVDCFGTFNGRSYVKCAEYLENYKYHIAVENQISNGYFTEKITNCFLAMTVPVYIGAPDIGRYFNPKGIISINKPAVSAVNEAIHEFCSDSDYEMRLDAVMDNFKKVQGYLTIEDYIYRHYSGLFQGEDL